MSKLYFPPDVLNKMVCQKCKNYLSCFPIKLKRDSSGAVCGRCSVTNAEEYIRDEAYERLAQFLLFPCVYKNNGCTEELVPSTLEKHEKCCLSRTYPCPNKIELNCQWSGPRVDIIEHFEQNHPDLLMKECKSFKVDFSKFSKENVILSYNDQLFLIKREVDSRKEIFICSVEHLKSSEEIENYDYFLKAESDDKNYFHKYSERNTDGQDITKVDFKTVNDLLHTPKSIFVTVKVMKTKRCQMNTEGSANADGATPDIKNNPDINWDMLAELECPVCFEYMLAPIYQCLNGHSICKECKHKVQACPMCQAALQDTKNFSLEKMTKFLIYPCKFYRSGCNHACKSSEIKQHEDSCEFGPYLCPVSDTANCQWKSTINEIVEHVDNNHNEYVLKNDKIDVAYDKNSSNRQETFEYLIKFSQRIFKLYYKFDNGKILWTTQLIGPVELSKKYNFEIDLVDYSANKRRCYLTAPVSQLTPQATCFANPLHCVTLTSEFVDPFVKKNVLGFSVLISNK